LWVGKSPCVFERKYVSVFPAELNLEEMRKAAKLLEGTHDFGAFCANKHMKKSTVRTLLSLEIVEQGNELVFFLKGNGFLHNMVRIIVGTLIEVGQGSRDSDSVEALFGAARAEAGATAEPTGLCLMEVEY
jgi:tRNA pseudouridine38-40 synthase